MEEKNVSWRRSVGFITRIRLSPRDVMSCIDAVNTVGVDMQGMSLSATVKRGISIALATLRAEKVLPERDGFEYSQMIAPYTNITKVEKIAVGHRLVMQEQREEAMDVPPAAIHSRTRPTTSRTELTKEEVEKATRRRRLFPRLQELQFRAEHDKENFSKKDQVELKRLEGEILK